MVALSSGQWLVVGYRIERFSRSLEKVTELTTGH